MSRICYCAFSIDNILHRICTRRMEWPFNKHESKHILCEMCVFFPPALGEKENNYFGRAKRQSSVYFENILSFFETSDWIDSNSTEPFQGQSAFCLPKRRKKKDNSDLKIFLMFQS